MEYYVYVLLNPLKCGIFKYDEYVFDYKPFYVGKGKRKRKYETLRDTRNPFKKSILIKIKNNNLKPIRIMIQTNLTEKNSFELEKKLIKLIGRKDLGIGILCNLTDGGDGSSGNIQSNETKLKRKKSLEKYRPYFKSDEFKEKMKIIGNETAKNLRETGYYDELSIKYSGSGNPMYGKHTSEKQKEGVRKAHAEGKIKLSEEGKQKVIEATHRRKGKKNSVKKSDSKIYKLMSPNGNSFIIFGAVDLQKFCKDNKLQFHIIKNNLGEITKEMVVGNKIFAKNTIGWKRI